VRAYHCVDIASASSCHSQWPPCSPSSDGTDELTHRLEGLDLQALARASGRRNKVSRKGAEACTPWLMSTCFLEGGLGKGQPGGSRGSDQGQVRGPSHRQSPDISNHTRYGLFPWAGRRFWGLVSRRPKPSCHPSRAHSGPTGQNRAARRSPPISAHPRYTCNLACMPGACLKCS
jgi:hypothetical protein